jgi:hypothetical protein
MRLCSEAIANDGRLGSCQGLVMLHEKCKEFIRSVCVLSNLLVKSACKIRLTASEINIVYHFPHFFQHTLCYTYYISFKNYLSMATGGQLS